MELAGGKLPGALDGALWAGKPPELLPQFSSLYPKTEPEVPAPGLRMGRGREDVYKRQDPEGDAGVLGEGRRPGSVAAAGSRIV